MTTYITVVAHIELNPSNVGQLQLENEPTGNALIAGDIVGTTGVPSERADASQPDAAAGGSPPLSHDEIIRRLRVLRQPATLFGETNRARYIRLLEAERDLYVEDEAAGGQQANLHTALQREQKEQARHKRLKVDKITEATHSTDGKVNEVAPSGQIVGITSEEYGVLENEVQAQLMASFQAAAEALAERNMAVEDRITKWLQQWMKAWEDDLAARDLNVKSSAAGRQADMRFQETERYLRPLYDRLRQRTLDPQLLAGIKLIVDAVKDRNYLHAYKLYMGVAIGNSPWPIGVTQVGLHERSAREKISFKYASGSAHIMNDEATRKFIQALKRLMTFCQRRYPTDPSRSVDFDGVVDAGRGVTGAGSDKTALLEAVARGETIVPAAAPSHLDSKGAVKIPEKWDQIIRDALKEVAASDAAEAADEARHGKESYAD